MSQQLESTTSSLLSLPDAKQLFLWRRAVGEESVHYLSSSSFGLRRRRGGGESILPLAIADRCACAAAAADGDADGDADAGQERRVLGIASGHIYAA